MLLIFIVLRMEPRCRVSLFAFQYFLMKNVLQIFIFNILNCVYLWSLGGICTHECRCLAVRDVAWTATGITGIWEPPGFSAVNLNWVPSKSSMPWGR